jgi:hypothetical protein
MNTPCMNQLPPILSIGDLVQAMNLSHSSLSLLLNDDTFPVVLAGHQQFVLRDSLLEWLKAHEQPKLRRDVNGS